MRRWIKFLPPVLGVLVLTGIIFGLHGALSHIGPGDILAALGATPGAQIYHALGFLALSFSMMVIYDIPGILFAKRLISFPRLGLHRIALASFCAYALSHVLGAPAISAAAIRVRLYAQWHVPVAGIARIITLSGTMFTLGAAALAGGILVLRPRDIPLFGHDISAGALQLTGGLLWAIVAGYVAAARRGKPLDIFGRKIPLPGLRLAIAQILLSCTDISIVAAILFTILPTMHGLTYPHVLAIYLAAFGGGLVSGLPGGVGVFDSLLLLGLSGYMDTAGAIGAILLFRVLYYLIPACVAALCFAGYEIFLTAKGEML